MIAYELPQAMQAEARSPTAFAKGAFQGAPQVAAFIAISTISGARIFAFTGATGSEPSQLDSAQFGAERAQRLEEARLLAQSWKQCLLDPEARTDANTLTLTARPVFQALLKYGPGAVDLRGLHAEGVNGVHLALVLRATLTRKALTPGWEEALSVARVALRRDGLSEEDALGGLIYF